MQLKRQTFTIIQNVPMNHKQNRYQHLMWLLEGNRLQTANTHLKKIITYLWRFKVCFLNELHVSVCGVSICLQPCVLQVSCRINKVFTCSPKLLSTYWDEQKKWKWNCFVPTENRKICMLTSVKLWPWINRAFTLHMEKTQCFTEVYYVFLLTFLSLSHF